MPCHWKGWAVLIVGVCLALSSVFALIWLLDAIGSPDLEVWAFFLIVPFNIVLLVIAARHS